MNECLGEITVFKKSGGPLTKRLALRDRKIVNDSSACFMARGSAHRVKIDSVQALADLINNFAPNQAYALGRLKDGVPDGAKVVVADELKDAGDPSVIARTKKYLIFKEGEPGFVLLDIDVKDMPDTVKRSIEGCGGPWGALCKVFPELKTVARVERASTSSGLQNSETGETFPGSGGMHIVIPVREAADVPRFLSDFHDRLWLAGFGWGMVSAAGSFLEHSLVDRSCGSPEHLVFEAAPIIVPPLVQKGRKAVAHDGLVLDTRLCAPLTDAEKAGLQKLKTAEESRLLPEREARRAAWSVSHIKRLTDRGMSEAEARAQVDRWIDWRELGGDFPLLFDDPSIADATVADVLAAPDDYIGKTLSDPFEGPAYGRGKAKLFRRKNGSLFINSFAHGGIKYELVDDDAEIERLAKLPPLQYDQGRKAAAKKLGVRVPVLDDLVARARAKLGSGADKDGPALYDHWAVEPWPEPVDGGIVLRALKEVVQRYVFMSKDLAIAVALWINFSWLHEFLTHSPLLYVTSAERDSGKSTLLGVLNFLVRRALQSVDISGPALFRSITKWQPTLIVDEADDALADNPDLRSVINSGWTRGQGAVRCHPDTHEPELFSTFAPKIVAMKGRNLPDTTLSRSITIIMKPRRAGDPKEHAADFDHLDNETFARLRSQLMRFAADNAEAIAKATPEIPPGFHNRRRANWTTLLAIAEACGGEWKTAAWAAARAIEAVADTFDPSIGVELLRAIKAAFAARAADRIKSADLLNELVADATAPWATYNKGKQISERQVAGLLKPYGIKPKTIRLDDGTAKGYLLEWFTDVFARYCASSTEEPPSSAKADDPSPRGGSASPTEEPTSSSPERMDETEGEHPSSPQADNLSVTSVTSLNSHDFSQFFIRHKPDGVTDKKDEKTFENNDVTDVTDKKGVGAKGNAQPPYEVLGPASAGERCTICGKGGGVKRIKHGGEVDLWHEDCGRAHLAAMADPPFKLPDLGPDPLDEHGAPLAAHTTPSTNGGPVLSPFTIRDLANWYEEEAARRRVGINVDQDTLDRDLCRLMAKRGVSPEFISAEFERVMQVVFPM